MGSLDERHRALNIDPHDVKEAVTKTRPGRMNDCINVAVLHDLDKYGEVADVALFHRNVAGIPLDIVGPWLNLVKDGLVARFPQVSSNAASNKAGARD